MRAVRNARAEYGVEEKARVAATIVIEDAALRKELEAEIQVGMGCVTLQHHHESGVISPSLDHIARHPTSALFPAPVSVAVPPKSILPFSP